MGGSLNGRVNLESTLFLEALVEIKIGFDLWPSDIAPEYISHSVKGTKMVAKVISVSIGSLGITAVFFTRRIEKD